MNAMIWKDLMMQQAQFEQQQRFQLQQMLHQQQMIQMQQNQEENDDEDSCPEEQRTLFIANLDDTKVDEEILYELFLQAGPIEKVSFPKNKSFAFITYIHSFSPAYAMHLYQGVKLFGTPVVIKFNGKTALPPLMRRLLPPDYGLPREYTATKPHNPFSEPPQSQQRRSFDNSALRSSRFAAFTDHGNDRNHRRDNSPRDRSHDNRRHERSPTRRRQDIGPDRARSRSHHSNPPYEKRRY